MTLSVTTACARANGTTSATTSAFTVYGGTLYVVACDSCAASAFFTVSDSASNAWTQWYAPYYGQAWWYAIYSGQGDLGTTTLTVTNTSGYAISCQVYRCDDANSELWLGGAYGYGQSTANSYSPSIYSGSGGSTMAGSIALVTAQEDNRLGLPTSSDLTISTWHNASYFSGLSGYKQLGAVGAQTANLNAYGFNAAMWYWSAIEIAPPTRPGPRAVSTGAIVRASRW